MKHLLKTLSLVGLSLVYGNAVVRASGIFGTMSNFDVYNETETEAHGAEIELEGIHIEDIYRTFPSNYDQESISEYVDGATFGTRIVYSGYNFNPSGFLAPVINPPSTNGHTCVSTEGCEHFGFSVRGVQPTAARYYWHDQNNQRIGTMPMAVPTPTWNYIPAGNPANAPRIEVEIEVPEPLEVIAQKPDSIWMKVYKTEIDRPVDLLELLSNNGGVVPEDIGELETEWALLEGGKINVKGNDLGNGNFAVIRRYEYFEYTGQVDAQNEPLTLFLDPGNLLEPPVGELGQFISANMVAMNLASPEEGDFDQDGDVDGVDFLAWQLGAAGQGNKLGDGDANWDDSVDSDDLAIWEDQFGAALAPLGGAVPEPASGVLMMIGMLVSFESRRRNHLGEMVS